MMKPRYDRFWRQAIHEIQNESNKIDFDEFNKVFQSVFDTELVEEKHASNEELLKQEQSKIEQLQKDLNAELAKLTDISKTVKSNLKELDESELQMSVYQDVVLPQESRCMLQRLA